MHEPAADADLLRAAFRDVHGVRLHGFALIVVLGDRVTAARLASETIAAHAADAPRLRHPERAAAVLRAGLLGRARRERTPVPLSEPRRAALAHLGIDGPAAAALAQLRPEERAALVASQVERFGDEDLATILRTTAGRARRAAMAARRRFIDHFPGGSESLGELRGPIAERVRGVSARAMGAPPR
jgi:DNA-directed RNA polymerase specialized sigma24 family protein